MKYQIISTAFVLFSLVNHALASDQGPVMIYAGTPVYLNLNQTISSAEVEVGHIVEFLVESHVTVNGQVVISAGSIAEGRITKVVKTCGRNCHVRCAQITIEAETVQAIDGQRIYLRSIPLTVKGNCYGNDPAVAKLGTTISARILNNIKINL